jgi:hypothetical protein
MYFASEKWLLGIFGDDYYSKQAIVYQKEGFIMLHSIAKLDSRLPIISTIEETDVITIVAFVESKSATCPQSHELRREGV